MRFVFAPLLLILVPVLVIAHLQHYSWNMQEPLFEKAGSALSAPEFTQVRVSLNYMDVTLKGRVADADARVRARKLVDEIPGLRCREQDNFIQVTARLDGTLAGKKLRLSGWLHDDAALRDAARWLAEARPGIEVDTSEVRVSPHVMIADAAPDGGMPAAFRPAWEAIEAPASLKIARQNDGIAISGHVNSPALKDAVAAAVTLGSGAVPVDASGLEAGAYVREARFANEAVLVPFLRVFFGSPGAERFEADAEVIAVTGDATPATKNEWDEKLEPLTRESESQVDIRVFPSVFHFPSRVRESQGTAEALTALEEVLRASVIRFEPGQSAISAAEQPKIEAMASAIGAAGPDVRLVVGGQLDLTGDPKDNAAMARKRAEGVIAGLVGKGVPAEALEAAVFETAPGEADRERQVEVLIK